MYKSGKQLKIVIAKCLLGARDIATAVIKYRILAKDCPGINKKGGNGSPDGRAMNRAKGSEISTVDSTFKENLQIRRAESCEVLQLWRQYN